MAREQSIPRLSLVPSSDVSEAKIEDLPMEAEAIPSQAEAGAANPSEDSDDIDIEEDNTIIRPMKACHVDFRKSKIKGG